MAVKPDIIVDFQTVSPDEAIKSFESQGLKVTATQEATKKAVEKRLFAITQSINMQVLQDTRDLITKALKDGTPYKTFQLDFQNMLASKGWTGERIIKLPSGDKKLLATAPARLKLIYNNAVTSSINAGRFKRFEDNIDDRPYLELHELQDSVARPKHRRASGTIQPVGGVAWRSPRSMVPSNGHHCRGWITSLTFKQAKAKGIKLKRPAGFPDRGFGFNPATRFFKPKKKDFDSDIWKAGQNMKASKL